MGDTPDHRTEALPGLSVVIPCFNQAPYVRECIDSVLGQAADLEVIVVDDGSTDDSAAIAEEYAPRVRLIRQSNGGPACARNTGFAASRRSLVCFLDGDDMFSPGFVEAILGSASENPSSDVFVANWRTLGIDGELGSSLSPPVTNDDAFHSWLRQGWGPPICFIVKREMLVKAGPFDQDRRVFGNEDWDMWLRIAAADARFQSCPGAEAVYRVTSGSVSSNAVRQWNTRRVVLAKAMALHPRCLQCRWSAIANGPNYVEHVIFTRLGDRSWLRLLSLAVRAPSMSVPLARALGRHLAARLRINIGRLRRRFGSER